MSTKSLLELKSFQGCTEAGMENRTVEDLSTASQLTFADWYFKTRCYCRAFNVRKDCCEVLTSVLVICYWWELLGSSSLVLCDVGEALKVPHSFGPGMCFPWRFAKKVSMWQKQGKKSAGKRAAGCLLWPHTAPPSESWGLAWKQAALLL